MPSYTNAELFTAPLTFMGAPAGLPGPKTRAAILGLPFDCGTHPLRVGARGGPDAVRQASQLKRRFNPTHANVDAITALGAVDCGNVRLTPGRIQDAFERIEQAVTRVAETGAVPVTIGGDGAISVPVARAMAKRHRDMVALHIDAHTDAYDYDPADKLNASTQFTHIAEEGLIDPSCSWHVGIRGTTYFDRVIAEGEAAWLHGHLSGRSPTQRLRTAHGGVPASGPRPAGLSLLRHGRTSILRWRLASPRRPGAASRRARGSISYGH